MSLFSKKSKGANEEPRDDYIELGTTALIADGSQVSISNKVYNVTFDEMVARVGKITSTKDKGNAYIVQQFMLLRDYNEMIDRNRLKNLIDK